MLGPALGRATTLWGQFLQQTWILPLATRITGCDRRSPETHLFSKQRAQSIAVILCRTDFWISFSAQRHILFRAIQKYSKGIMLSHGSTLKKVAKAIPPRFTLHLPFFLMQPHDPKRNFPASILPSKRTATDRWDKKVWLLQEGRKTWGGRGERQDVYVRQCSPLHKVAKRRKFRACWKLPKYRYKNS